MREEGAAEYSGVALEWRVAAQQVKNGGFARAVAFVSPSWRDAAPEQEPAFRAV